MSSVIPDMQYINRELSIADVARTLDLRFAGNSKIHCWHPERHQNGDRTASVGIRMSNNTVKCFGCDSPPMGPINLVMDALAMDSPADAALWIAARFSVPTIPARKRLTDHERRRDRVGHEQGLGLLIRSGIWARLSAPAQSLAAVLFEFGEREKPTDDSRCVTMAYRTLARRSGVQSHNAIRRSLVELSDAGFLVLPAAAPRCPDRKSATYIVTPNSQTLWELAGTIERQTKQEIAAEIELRRRQKLEKLRAYRAK